MEKGLKGYRPLLLLLLCGGMTLKAAAQAAITDTLNTAQSTLPAGNTAATVQQVTEPVEQQLPQDAGRGGEDGHEGAAGHHFGRAGRGGEQRRHHLPDHGHTRQ